MPKPPKWVSSVLALCNRALSEKNPQLRQRSPSTPPRRRVRQVRRVVLAPGYYPTHGLAALPTKRRINMPGILYPLPKIVKEFNMIEYPGGTGVAAMLGHGGLCARIIHSGEIEIGDT